MTLLSVGDGVTAITLFTPVTLFTLFTPFNTETINATTQTVIHV